jgi:hypothetical protein
MISSTFAGAKKLLSFLMPDRLEQWTIRDNTGNPTELIPENQVIKHFKRPRSARRVFRHKPKETLKLNESQKTLEILE